jgi:hypothetical protein
LPSLAATAKKHHTVDSASNWRYIDAAVDYKKLSIVLEIISFFLVDYFAARPRLLPIPVTKSQPVCAWKCPARRVGATLARNPAAEASVGRSLADAV